MAHHTMYMISESTKTSKLVPITPPIMPPAMAAELEVAPREGERESSAFEI